MKEKWQAAALRGPVAAEDKQSKQAASLQKDRLAAEVRDEPEEEGERDAEEQTGDDWKVERSVFAAVNDVAGQFSQAEWKLVTKVEKGAEKDEHSPKEKKRAAEFPKRVHSRILSEAVEECLRKRLPSSPPTKALDIDVVPQYKYLPVIL